ncbi:MAG: ferrous iron transport protein B [bacterium]
MTQIPKECKDCGLVSTRLIGIKTTRKLRIALVGQPNSGKSTFFNSLSNFKVNTANYSGTTVEYHITKINIKNYQIELIDLPGTFSLNYTDIAEKVTFDILTNINQDFKVDGIIQVVETVSLPHALVLTLDLLTLDIPIVIALNMYDEARIKGINVDIPALEKILNVPVVPTISIKGENTLKALLKLIEKIEKRSSENLSDNTIQDQFTVDQENNFLYRSSFAKEELPFVIKAYKKLWKNLVEDIFRTVNCHFENCKLVPACLMNIEKYAPSNKSLAQVRDEILKLKSNIVISVSSFVFKIDKPRPTFDDIADRVILHKFWGYVSLTIIIFTAFYLSYFIGNWLADLVDKILGPFSGYVDNLASNKGIWEPLIVGLKEGIMGGIGIVLPYLVPFLIFISILEDSGYIPRMMYLMDNFLKPLGITGRSVLSFVLGLGCNVSAIMSLRGSTKYNERILAGMVIPFVPCSARTVVIMSLVNGYLGFIWGVFMYLLSLIVIMLVLLGVNKFTKNNLPYFMVHIPPYRMPSVKSVLTKIWLRFKSFLFTAWPILIAGTIILSYLSFFKLDNIINYAFSFLTVGILGLPENTAIPLIFGILAKEYALVMLFSSLDNQAISSFMTNLQIFIFSVFILLYTPCISTIATQVREIGLKYTLISIGLSFMAALLIAFTLGRVFNLLGVF